MTPSGTLAERYQHGIRLRRKAARQKHADLHGPDERDAVAILARGDRTRVPELVPVRYDRMLTSPFAFLRGAAAVMAEDLRYQPAAGIGVQACGDCHLMNFGAFATPEDNILFDINDFDETLPGVDFTADVKRLAASVAVAALAAQLSNKRARALAAATVEAYRSRLRVLAKLSPLETWHNRIELWNEIKHIDDRALRRQLHAIITKAGKRLEEDDNFPHLAAGTPARIVDKPPVIYHFTRKRDARHRVDAASMFAAYRKCLSPERLWLFERYSLQDIAFKAVGVGSVGTFCAVGLFTSGDGVPLFLQVKEAGKSVFECLGPKYKGHPGRRVVEGQHVMQAASDISGVDAGRGVRPAFLCAPAEEPSARFDQRACGGERPRQLRAPVRAHARPCPRALRRSGRARRIHGQERRLRRCAGIFRHGLRGAHAN